MQSIFFALISYFGWGIGDIFGILANRKLKGVSSAFYFSLIAFLIDSLYVPFAFTEVYKFSPQTLLICIVLSALNTIPLIAFYEALKLGSAAVVITITSSFAAVAVLLSMIFLKESISFYQGLAIATIFLGIILSSLDLKKLKDRGSVLNRGVFLAIVAMVLWGVIFTFIKIPVREVGWFWPGYIFMMGFPLTAFFMKVRKIKLVKPKGKTFVFLILAAMLISIGGFAYNMGISKGLVSVVTPIASSAATLTVLLSFLILKDPITKQQIFGIMTTLIGIVLLSVFSV